MTGARELVDQIVSGSGDSGHLANHLLIELRRGVPVELLRPLLSSPDGAVVAIGTWIASELAELAAPLAGDLQGLLRHPHREVRFFAIDAVTSTATGSHADRAAAIPAMLDDPDQAVRWKASGFLARASEDQLRAARDYLRASSPDDPHLGRLDWLLSAEPAGISAALASADILTRRYAAAAAARVARRDRGPLMAAARAPDPEIRRFAEDMLASASSRSSMPRQGP